MNVKRNEPEPPTVTLPDASVVWVSGSRGKLGREVCRQLRAAGVEVLEADAHGPSPVELTDPEAVARSMRGATAVIHCAAIPSPEHIEPSELVRNNTMACFNALEQAWLAGVRTAVLISHRFSSVRMADRILVMAGGEIEASGTHEALLAQRGRYAELFELQAAGYR